MGGRGDPHRYWALGMRGVLILLGVGFCVATGEPPPDQPVRRWPPHQVLRDTKAPLRVRSLSSDDRDQAVAELLDSARLQYAQRRYGDALEDLEAALSIDPANAEAGRLLAAAIARRRALEPIRRQFEAADFPAALRLLYRSTDTIDPEVRQGCLHAAWFNLAVVHARASAYREAWADLSEAEVLIPNAPHCRVARAVLEQCETFDTGRCLAAEGIPFLNPEGLDRGADAATPCGRQCSGSRWRRHGRSPSRMRRCSSACSRRGGSGFGLGTIP